MKVVIVSRHEATVNYLKKRFPNADVISHMSDPSEYRNCLIIGNLPINVIDTLLKNGNRFVMVSLDIPKELRGKELGEEELKRYAKFYEVRKLELEEFKL